MAASGAQAASGMPNEGLCKPIFAPLQTRLRQAAKRVVSVRSARRVAVLESSSAKVRSETGSRARRVNVAARPTSMWKGGLEDHSGGWRQPRSERLLKPPTPLPASKTWLATLRRVIATAWLPPPGPGHGSWGGAASSAVYKLDLAVLLLEYARFSARVVRLGESARARLARFRQPGSFSVLDARHR